MFRCPGNYFFGVIIAGVVVNTIFLVREIRRNEQQDSFLNAVHPRTEDANRFHSPVSGNTAEPRHDEAQQPSEFYRIM
jgi:hypothetical protein